MPNFRPFAMCLRPYENGLRVVITPLVLPIRIHEDP